MKRFLLSVVFATSLVFTSCQFDDSAIWGKINDHEKRIVALEELCKQMNTNISSLQSIVEALQKNDYVTNVAPMRKDGEIIGYTITFAHSDTITIYHGENGKDGANGKDGYTPQIGVMKDTDGIYYWTVDGDWLLDGKGNKIQANGINGTNGTNGSNGQDGSNGTNGVDGITPRLKIENDYWYVSYDNGATWTELGKATGEDGSNGEDGDSIFSSVTQDDEYVYFNLTDGTMITLPKHNSDIIQFEDLAVKAVCCKNWDTNEDGELSYNEAESVISIDEAFSSNTSVIAFNEFKYFTSVSDIPNNAFKGCTNLWKITLPSSVSTIGEYAFSSCKSLANIELPQDVVTIGAYAFAYCEMLKSIIIPEGVIDIGYGAFRDCIGLLKVDISDNVINIGSSAFYGCTSLETTTLGQNVTTIGASAFSKCRGKLIIRCNIPNSTDQSRFIEGNFSEIVIENTVLQIGDYAFNDASSITKVTMGESVKTIGKYAFAGCTKLKELAIGNNVYTIGERAFYNCNAITELSIPSSVKTISTYAFYACNGITKLIIPDNVSTIGSYSFASCSKLSQLTIGIGVTSIGAYAFSSNSKLEKVYCKPLNPPTLSSGYTGDTAFSNNATSRKFYVPTESLDKYTTANKWKSYTGYIIGYEF